ncbi:uncharacterized protein LOC133190557 [Saccostrea echinata]|uniref:uncharacterized protein LOC133190557 n=1 Tax=Saccostrea echinata TaxID=191078 RepID=UPI002A820CCD|nr:uncharacterized protein LOC133190557 [Saccostrea echinata]
MKTERSMESLRIYISGAHSTGKTTIIQDLCPHLPGVRVEMETARRIIEKHGWQRTDFHPQRSPQVFEQLNTEILLANIKIENDNFLEKRDFLCDRCLDPMAYVEMYLGPEAFERIKQTKELGHMIQRLRSAVIFLIEPQPECISDDKVRLVSTFEELCKYTTYLKRLYDSFAIPYVTVDILDRRERVSFILQCLHTRASMKTK